jgi:hypothetical protein
MDRTTAAVAVGLGARASPDDSESGDDSHDAGHGGDHRNGARDSSGHRW